MKKRSAPQMDAAERRRPHQRQKFKEKRENRDVNDLKSVTGRFVGGQPWGLRLCKFPLVRVLIVFHAGFHTNFFNRKVISRRSGGSFKHRPIHKTAILDWQSRQP
jgi:hypothetical protein